MLLSSHEGSQGVNTRDFIRLKQRKAELEAELKGVEAEIREAQDDLLAQFADAGRTSETVDGYTVYRHPQLWASPAEGARVELVDALRETGHAELTTVNSQTLSSFVRESLAAWSEGRDLTKEDVSDLIADGKIDWDEVMPGIGRFLTATEKTTLNMRRSN